MNNDSHEWEGSVPINSAIWKLIKENDKIGLDRAINYASEFTEGKTKTISIKIGMEKGYLVYKSLVIDEKDKIKYIVIDAGSGDVLDSGDFGGGGGDFSGGGASGGW